jgi:hypothetical protein
MSAYFFEVDQEKSDLSHYYFASEREYGVQCVILYENSYTKDYTLKLSKIFKLLNDGRPQAIQEVALLHVAPPGSFFDMYDKELYKFAMIPAAYFKLMEFFKSEFALVLKRMESDYQTMQKKTEWIKHSTDISFRGIANIVYRQELDSTNTFVLNLKVTKSGKTGKTKISLIYSDDNLGTIHLPPVPMTQLALTYPNLLQLYNYKDLSTSKKSRQS